LGLRDGWQTLMACWQSLRGGKISFSAVPQTFTASKTPLRDMRKSSGKGKYPLPDVREKMNTYPQ
jgi:hypothetical protein